ncbi:MAG: hypothetical protein NDF51_01710 [archaeon YNP-WB-040]|nr:hypothetical protein [Candidatus Culexarchaeum yellowstonense]
MFDSSRFRPADVSILMSDTRKIQRLGFKVTKSLEYIIRGSSKLLLKSK